MKKPTRREDARQRMYHDLVFESAEAVFAKKGMERSTMQEVAKEAGISLKTLYTVVGSKQELQSEILRVRAESFLDSVREGIASEGDALERLEAGIRAYTHFLFEHEEWLQIHLRRRLALDVPARGTRKRDAAPGFWKEGLEGFAGVIEDGIRQGLFYDDDPVELALSGQAVMQVEVARATEQGENDPDAVADSILRLVRRLLCRPT
ncbi:TetR/AcrR family transcriptional regulator [Methylobacterium sp.]|uniref:TetR/AcrR family transcriptional regulator n=1 Tax=Methylobacterium sp. TaxID=409 RepID=UPI003B017A93